MPPKQTKTCIILDGADTKYKGFKRLSPEQLNASAERLSTQPKRYQHQVRKTLAYTTIMERATLMHTTN